MSLREIMAKEIDRIAGLLTSDVRDCSKELDAAFMGHEYEVRQAFIKTLTEEIGDMLDRIPHDKDCHAGQEIEVGMIEECSCGRK